MGFGYNAPFTIGASKQTYWITLPHQFTINFGKKNYAELGVGDVVFTGSASARTYEFYPILAYVFSLGKKQNAFFRIFTNFGLIQEGLIPSPVGISFIHNI